MHGFACATNVAAAWIRGEHEDARELAVLYGGRASALGTCAGRPSHRHARATIIWRMERETASYLDAVPAETAERPVDDGPVDRNQNPAEDGGPIAHPLNSPLELPPQDPGSSSPENLASQVLRAPTVDRFYRERLEVREVSGYLRRHGRPGAAHRLPQPRGRHNADPDHPPVDGRPAGPLEGWPLGPLFGIHRAGGPAVPGGAGGILLGTPVGVTYAAEKLLFWEHMRVSGRAPVTRTIAAVPIHRHLVEHGASAESTHTEPADPPLSLSVDFFAEDGVGGRPALAGLSSSLSTYTASDPFIGQSAFEWSCDDTKRTLMSFVETRNWPAFEEALADFWDTVFPATAGVDFFDGSTPVPRPSAMAKFLTEPCPRGFGVMQCEIERLRCPSNDGRRSVKERFFPNYEYRLFIRDRSDDHSDHPPETILMTATSIGRQGLRRGVNNYGIFPHSGSNDGTRAELGRLQSNFVGTEFQIFAGTDAHSQTCRKDGMSTAQPQSRQGPSGPTHRHEDDISTESSSRDVKKKSPWPRPAHPGGARVTPNPGPHALPPREFEDGAITYTANLLGNRPRIMDVCIPRVKSDGTLQRRRPREGDVEPAAEPAAEPGSADISSMRMLSRFKKLLQELNEGDVAAAGANVVQDEMDDSGLLALQNRQPWWNFELGAFVLNFGGRVSVASVKNFQLCERSRQDHVMLQFGRIGGRHSFTMDFQHPLTAFQAFAIAISSLQSKIAIA